MALFHQWIYWLTLRLLLDWIEGGIWLCIFSLSCMNNTLEGMLKTIWNYIPMVYNSLLYTAVSRAGDQGLQWSTWHAKSMGAFILYSVQVSSLEERMRENASFLQRMSLLFNLGHWVLYRMIHVLRKNYSELDYWLPCALMIFRALAEQCQTLLLP